MLLLRVGIRFLRRNWLLSLSAIAVLAAGTSASALAMVILLLFSKPAAPGTKPGNFATIAEVSHGGPLRPMSWRSFERLQSALAVEGLAASAYADSSLVPLGRPQHRQYTKVSAASREFLELFAEPMSAGTSQLGDQESCSNEEPIVVSADLAQRVFGGPSTAINQPLRLRDTTFRVSGVAPASFRGLFGSLVDAWIPAHCVGRVFLNIGVESPRMGGEANALLARADLWKDYPVFYAIVADRRNMGVNSLVARSIAVLHAASSQDGSMSVNPGLTIDPERDRRMRKWASLGIFLTVCLTLASSLNFGGLLLARIPKQMAEVCFKQAIGASIGRLFTELCAGPLLIVLLAFLSAASLFVWAMPMLGPFCGAVVELSSISTSRATQTIGWELLIALLIGIIIAVIPAVRLLRESGAPRMSYTATSSPKTMVTLQAVVAAQLGFSIAVLVVAAMAVNASRQIFRADMGFQAEHRSVFAISLLKDQPVSLAYRDDAPFPLVNAASQVRQRLAPLAGIRSVAFSLRGPLDLSDMSLHLQLADSAAPRSVAFNAVSQNYFDSLGMRFVAGHSFSSDSLIGVPAEVVANHSLVKLLWPADSALGKTVKVALPATGITASLRVIGVVDDARTIDPRSSPQPAVYLPFRGTVLSGVLPWYAIVDGHMPMPALEKLTNDEVAKQLPGMGVVYSYSLQERLTGLLKSERQQQTFAMTGGFVVALIALTGVYSSLRYFVSTKQREFAIRSCCGATASEIAMIVLSKAIQNALAAVAISFLGWPLLKHLVSSTLLDAAWSPILASAMTALGGLFILLVSLPPALAASRVPINAALRAD